MTTLEITVHGTPAPQGSKNVNRHGAVYESSKRVKPWRDSVISASLDAILAHARDNGWAPLAGPVGLEVYFHFPRPKGHYGTGRNAGKLKASAPLRPAVAPDLSKLIRSTEDALTEAGVWRDDALVVHVSAGKFYDGHGFTGANITITEFRRDLR